MPADLPATKPLSDYTQPISPAIFSIDGGDVPWGDYGSILVHGMTAHLGRKGGDEGTIQLERTGPFVPPITFPGAGDVIVTDGMKQAMEAAGFQGVSFRPVSLAHIVDVPWHTWDLKAEEPPFYPEDGEPEGYILDKAHNSRVAAQMGTIWEVVLQDGAEVKRVQVGRNSWDVKFHFIEGSTKGFDMFSVPQNGYKYVSERAKRWFETHFGQWTSFKPVQ
jgi:hypothetical protein